MGIDGVACSGGSVRHNDIEAPCAFDGPINSERFSVWLKQILCPTLQLGDIVIMDNHSSHKRSSVRDAIRATRTRLLFLLPYSPDLNSIEQTFSKIKHWLRIAQESSIDTVQSALADVIDTALQLKTPTPRVTGLIIGCGVGFVPKTYSCAGILKSQ